MEQTLLPCPDELITIAEEKGLKQGLELGALKATQEMIIEILIERFGIVSDSVKKAIKSISDAAKTNLLFKTALRTDSLQEFKENLFPERKIKAKTLWPSYPKELIPISEKKGYKRGFELGLLLNYQEMTLVTLEERFYSNSCSKKKTISAMLKSNKINSYFKAILKYESMVIIAEDEEIKERILLPYPKELISAAKIKGLKKGFKQSLSESSKEMLIEALEVRFSIVSDSIKETISTISKNNRLQFLYVAALRASSIQEFKEILLSK